jgi:magnesium transporter
VIRTVIERTQGLTWVDVVEPTSAELTEIADLYGLHPSSVRDSLDPEHLPVRALPDRYFAIIRVFDVASSADCATVHEMTRKVAIFAGPDLVVTIHRKELPFLTNLQQQWRVGDTGDGNGEPATHRLILDVIEQSRHPAAAGEDRRVDAIEEALFQNRHESEDLADLYVQRRTTLSNGCCGGARGTQALLATGRRLDTALPDVRSSPFYADSSSGRQQPHQPAAFPVGAEDDQ